jgi:RNA polymerase sigma-70 factor (ECF subfamily)
MSTSIGPDLIPLLPRLKRYALTLCRSAPTADDLVQAACMRALAHEESWERGTRLDAWVFCILRNLWFDQVRQEARRLPAEETGEEVAADRDDERVFGRLLLQDVMRSVAELPAEQQEVLLLVCVEDLSYREAAEILKVPIGTVMSRLARARRRLGELTDVRPPSPTGTRQSER